MGCSSSQPKPELPELNLTEQADFASILWICDIEEAATEPDCDFLFQANISAYGTALKTMETEAPLLGKCIFGDIMYDVNQFIPDEVDDGSLSFKIVFGKGCSRYEPGWTVEFQNLNKVGNNYVGQIITSWWGTKNVTLLPYSYLTPEQKTKYPDLKAKYDASTGAYAPKQPVNRM